MPAQCCERGEDLQLSQQQVQTQYQRTRVILHAWCPRCQHSAPCVQKASGRRQVGVLPAGAGGRWVHFWSRHARQGTGSKLRDACHTHTRLCHPAATPFLRLAVHHCTALHLQGGKPATCCSWPAQCSRQGREGTGLALGLSEAPNCACNHTKWGTLPARPHLPHLHCLSAV